MLIINVNPRDSSFFSSFDKLQTNRFSISPGLIWFLAAFSVLGGGSFLAGSTL